MWVWLLRLFGVDPAKATKQLEVLPAAVTEHRSEEEKPPPADVVPQSAVELSPPASEPSGAGPLAKKEPIEQPPAAEDQPTPESTAEPAAMVLVPPTAVVLQDLARPGLFRPAYGAARLPKFLSPDQIVRGALELHPAPAITVKPDLVLEETRQPAASPASPRRTEPALSTEFLLQVEFILFSEPDPQRSSEANRQFALTPLARAAGALLRDGVLERWRQQKPPLGPQEFYDMALAMAPGPSGALQLCHNVARTFADGGAAIPWSKLNRGKALYSTGLEYFQMPPPAALERESSFLNQVFDESISDDRSDWQRFFGAAWLVQSRLFVSELSAIGDEEWRQALVRSADFLRAHPGSEPAGSWFWANAVYFHEAAVWGKSFDRSRDSQRAAFEGAKFARSLNDAASSGPAPWFVAKAGSREIVEEWRGARV